MARARENDALPFADLIPELPLPYEVRPDFLKKRFLLRLY
jgi:hypothetical protein